MIFAEYADYYDIIYQDKDYKGEVNYVKSLIDKTQVFNNSKVQTLLDLGCGTGKHAVEFAKLGYDVTGVDLSVKMITEAKAKCSDNLDFQVGDIRDFSVNKSFDVIISLFHVMSYITKNDDLIKVLINVSNHLKPNGIFVFDCWYGPGVLSNPPTIRIKRWKLSGESTLLRLSEPTMDTEKGTVDVKFTLFDLPRKPIMETHKMRYFFKNEILFALEKVRLNHKNLYKWMTFEPALKDTWNAIFILQKNENL